MRVCELPQFVDNSNAPPSQHSAGGSRSGARPASLYHPYPPMRLAGCLSEAHNSGETQTLEARGVSVTHSTMLTLLSVRQGTLQE
jgi:hypothetical protein